MKRILVLDNSEATRETIEFLLESEFIVEKRAVDGENLTLPALDTPIDVIILGVPRELQSGQPQLAAWARSAPCPVLFLVNSPSSTQAFANSARTGCLSMPFDPYRLRAEVERLAAAKQPESTASPGNIAALSIRANRYAEYPFISRANAMLVHRFVAAGLPVLVFGELGCGQENVVQTMASLAGPSPLCLSAAEINESYLREQDDKLTASVLGAEAAITITIHGIEQLTMQGQHLLLNFLTAQEEKVPRRRFLATANGDLLQRVYSGQFLVPLYYRLATLTLRLAPLRERCEDIPALAQTIADSYAPDLNLGVVSFSTGARQRLGKYLWFGNANELEMVITRTLAIQRKSLIEETDLIFDVERELAAGSGMRGLANPAIEPEAVSKTHTQNGAASHSIGAIPHAHDGSLKALPDLRVFIHELAHEIKNPMVTIKTFAQLLADRYEDEAFRARYKEVVDDDIGRIDQLLQVMIEFADFGAPRLTTTMLDEQIRPLLIEMSQEFAARQVPIDYKNGAQKAAVHADESHVRYIFKNVLLAALNQAKAGTQMSVEIVKPGQAVIAYTGEENRVAAVPGHLAAPTLERDEGGLPLRMLLAKQLVERNDGRLRMVYLTEKERNAIELELPIA